MFDFFKSRQERAEEYMSASKEYATVPTPYKAPAPDRKDHYRVGWDDGDGMVTLTLMVEGGFSTTMAITPTECERMIRMLRAAYPVDEDTTNE